MSKEMWGESTTSQRAEGSWGEASQAERAKGVKAWQCERWGHGVGTKVQLGCRTGGRETDTTGRLMGPQLAGLVC